jgi:hypothetical protein
MVAKKFLTAVLFVALVPMVAAYAETYVPDPAIRVKINLGSMPWKFTRGDINGAQNAAFNDAAWGTTGIPHTWGDTLSFLNMASGGPGNGYDGVAWYRNHFTLDNAYSGKKIFVEFRGAGIGA